MISRDQYDLAVWNTIARMASRSAIFLASPHISVADNTVRVSHGWTGLIVGLAFFLGMGTTMIAIGIFVVSSCLPWEAMLVVLGAGLCGVGLLLASTRPAVWWTQGGPHLSLRYGWFPWAMRQVEIPRRNLRVRLRLILASDSNSEQFLYQSMVELSRFDVLADRVRLAIGQRDDVLPLYELLKGFVGEDRATDLTCEISDGETDTAGHVEVCRAPLGRTGAGFESARLVWRSRHLAVLRPASAIRWFGAFFLCGGCFALLMVARPDDRPDGVLGCTMVTAIGGLFTLVGLWTVLFGNQTHHVSVDCTRQELRVRLIIPGTRQRTYRFSQVYAIQLCSTYSHGDGDSASCAGYELNIVFLEPRGLRIPILSHAHLGAVRQQARMLSDAMRKPLLDHTEGLTMENILRHRNNGESD